MPIGVNLSVELAGVVSAVEGSMEEEEDEEPGVEEPLCERAARRCKVGLRGLVDLVEGPEDGLAGSSERGSSSSSAESSSSRPFGYSAHEFCTW
jgi:hypothetical protein